ncbi:hypothetical protein V5799_021673 [Amblyomma americanum]|uniref:Uncharacterized protein n=1 Tax=Amblyomma americanum TaxID=6943 RepID=A0AAQ4FN82_AMBAM
MRALRSCGLVVERQDRQSARQSRIIGSLLRPSRRVENHATTRPQPRVPAGGHGGGELGARLFGGQPGLVAAAAAAAPPHERGPLAQERAAPASWGCGQSQHSRPGHRRHDRPRPARLWVRQAAGGRLRSYAVRTIRRLRTHAFRQEVTGPPCRRLPISSETVRQYNRT